MIRERARRARDVFYKRLLRVKLIRRWYARRVLAYIEKSRKKHRRLPDSLHQIDVMTRRQPKAQRLGTLEEMLTPGREEQYGREMRRAASRQNRASGRGGSGRRPGLPPQQAVRRQVKGPR